MSELAEGGSSPTAEGWEDTDSDMTVRVSATCTLHQELTANLQHLPAVTTGISDQKFPRCCCLVLTICEEISSLGGN